MLKIVFGTAGVSRGTKLIFEKIKEMSSPQKQFLLVPQRNFQDMERQLCQEENNEPICEIATFNSVYDKMCNQFGGGAQNYLDSGSKLLLMYIAVCETEKDMESYRSKSEKYTELSALLTTSEDCKHYQVNPQDITEAGNQLAELDGNQLNGREKFEGYKLHDIGMILTKYDQLVSQQSATDPADKLNQLEIKMEKTAFPSNCHFWMNGFSEFTPQELAVVEGMLRNGNDITILLDCDDPNGESDDIYTCTRHTARDLKELADRAGTDTDIKFADDEGGSVFSYLKANLFANPDQKWESSCPEVAVYAADNPRREVEHAASVILKLTKKNECRYRDFIVTGSRIDRYTDLIESIFSLAGINCSLDGDSRFEGKAVFTLVSSALDTVAGGFRYEDLSRYLKTGLTGIEDAKVDQLDNYALTWDLQGTDWTSREEWTMMPPDNDRNDRKDWKDHQEKMLADLKVINDTRDDVTEPLENFLNVFTEEGQSRVKGNGAAFAKALYGLLAEIKLQDSLIAKYRKLEETGEDRMAGGLRDQWSAVLCALELCVQYLDNMEMELEEFAALFKQLLGCADLGTTPSRMDEVTVAGKDRIPHQDAKYVIFLGADGNSLPDMKPMPGILTEQDRDALESAGIRIGLDQDARLSREFAQVGEIFSIPRDGLLVSWSHQSGQGAEMNQPSFLVERMKALFPNMGDGPLDTGINRPGLLAAVSHSRLSYWKPMRSIPPQAAVQLLDKGKDLTISPSGFSVFNFCRFKYFMEYGFDGRPVKRAQFGPLEYGNMMHAVLRDVMQYIADGDFGEPDWKEINNQVDLAFNSYFDKAVMVPAREKNRFLWSKHYMNKAARSTVRNAVEELYAGGFRPILIEKYFKNRLPDNSGMPEPEFKISGRIDRVDQCGNYLRIVDYKTGSDKFSYDEVLNGNLIQLPFYRMALQNCGIDGVDAENDIVAGMFYVPAAEPVLKGKTRDKETGISKSDTQRRRSGLLLDDDEILDALEKPVQEIYRFLPYDRPAKKVNEEFRASEKQMNQLDQYMIARVSDTCAAIINGDSLGGNMQANPYGSNFTGRSCKNCEFRQICHFEEYYEDKRKNREFSSVKSEAFWNEIAETVNSAEGRYNHGTDD